MTPVSVTLKDEKLGYVKGFDSPDQIGGMTAYFVTINTNIQ
jgi:hypothetical protein